MATIDYDKYEYMTRRQIVNSLLNAEKKYEKLKNELREKMQNSNNLIKFLRAKIEEELNKETPALNKIKRNSKTTKIEVASKDKVIQSQKQELEVKNQELEDKNKRIAELEDQLKRERKVNSDEFIDKNELKKKIKELKQKAKEQGIGKKFLKKVI
ncbi:hypothetical protein [Campylobacter devanensis]|uniref:hypothetical protein n=1 Tax=Campylobacter devanensis TaxID=3161138 RepID=UPI000A32DAA5|nr:hypothetical protein [Campylobacter sp. P160]